MVNMTMTVDQAISLMLRQINMRQQLAGNFGAVTGGTAGNIIMQQRDLNAAISRWRTTKDGSGLIQNASALHLYGHLSDTEYEYIMNALDKTSEEGEHDGVIDNQS